MELFKTYDKDGGGSLDAVEFTRLLRDELAVPEKMLSNNHIAEFMDALDDNWRAVRQALIAGNGEAILNKAERLVEERQLHVEPHHVRRETASHQAYNEAMPRQVREPCCGKETI